MFATDLEDYAKCNS